MDCDEENLNLVADGTIERCKAENKLTVQSRQADDK